MRLRLTKIDEFQFLTCLRHRVWGSKVARFNDWRTGDYLVFIVEKSVAGAAQIVGKPYTSHKQVWDNGLFPHRVDVEFQHAFLRENRPPILGEIRDALTSAWGPKYGWGIINQRPLEDRLAETVLGAVCSKTNDLDEFNANFERYLVQADSEQKAVKPKSASVVQRPPRPLPGPENEHVDTLDEEPAHMRAQNALIRLGKATGCAVWIASNDRRRELGGKHLGDGCLNSLPSLGLSKEAATRISLIDVMWLRQNAPVCAFEVEVTTSIYSGLLRMSDLLALVPALNMKLFIVAPRMRQEKVMAELARPTFQKIGLSDFCRFIPAEDLDQLLTKVAGLQGHVQPSIVDTISVELRDEAESALV